MNKEDVLFFIDLSGVFLEAFFNNVITSLMWLRSSNTVDALRD
jgi:hypothetical protein